jgi:hypothetical protein
MSPSWEANSCSAIQEIISILWASKVHYRFTNRSPVVPIQSQMNPMYTLQILVPHIGIYLYTVNVIRPRRAVGIVELAQ